MKRATQDQVVSIMDEVTADLERAAKLVAGACPNTEAELYRKRLGDVIRFVAEVKIHLASTSARDGDRADSEGQRGE